MPFRPRIYNEQRSQCDYNIRDRTLIAPLCQLTEEIKKLSFEGG